MASGGEKAIKAALLANFTIALMKLGGALLSGSAGMLAEFKHSVADSANGLFLLAGERQSKKQPNNQFQFGYGKTSFFWSFVAAIAMLSIGGILSIYGGINKILQPEELEHVGLNLAIIGASILFESYSLYTALKGICQDANQRAGGFKVVPTALKLLAKAQPTTRFIFFEDSAALLGLIMAGGALMLAAYTNNSVFDGIASVLIGFMLLTIGFYTAKENMYSITGEAASPELVKAIGDFARQLPQVRDIHRVKSMEVGPNIYLLNLIVEGDGNLRLAEVDEINFHIKQEIEKQFPEVRYTHVTMIRSDNKDDWAEYCKNL